MGFQKNESEALLVATGRCCCICGLRHSIQLHHITPKEGGGTDDIDNAIPLCPNCHSEVHGSHASGKTTRIYTAAELRGHRQHRIEQVENVGKAAREPETRTQLAGLATTFEQIEALMPKLIAEMRKDLEVRPLSREFVLLRRCWGYDSKGYELEYYYDDHDQLENMTRILQNCGLIKDITDNKVQRYVISEEFARYVAS
ncbi:MAG: HNH endonuclease [Acidobacteriia bacterium]|nr:HNH endonuclease [Terriglobia bacterium]